MLFLNFLFSEEIINLYLIRKVQCSISYKIYVNIYNYDH